MPIVSHHPSFKHLTARTHRVVDRGIKDMAN